MRKLRNKKRNICAYDVDKKRKYYYNESVKVIVMVTLKQIRTMKKVTQEEAAKYLKISRRTYQTYEALEKLEKIEKLGNDKYQYYCDKLSNLNKIDEDHGILTIEEIRNGVNSVFKNYNINFCYLFGSYAKNEAYDKSDIDLLIDTDVTGLDFYGLIEDLRSTLNKRIDLLKINQIVNNEDLLREIMKTGVKIYG